MYKIKGNLEVIAELFFCLVPKSKTKKNYTDPKSTDGHTSEFADRHSSSAFACASIAWHFK